MTLISSLALTNVRYTREAVYSRFTDINLFTGYNGVGKTTVLDFLFFIATGKWGRTHSYARPIPVPLDIEKTACIGYNYFDKTYLAKFDRMCQGWEDKLKNDRKDSVVLYVKDNNCFSIFNPWAKDKVAHLKESEIIHGVPNNESRFSRIGFGKLQYQLSSWKFTDPKRYESFIDLLSWFAPDDSRVTMEFVQSMDFLEAEDYPEFTNLLGSGSKKTYSFQAMDSGSRRVIEFCCLLVWIESIIDRFVSLEANQSSPNVILIMDKIESGLHPRYQKCLVEMIQNWRNKIIEIKKIKFQLFATTYSDAVADSIRAMVKFDKLCHQDITVYNQAYFFHQMTLNQCGDFDDYPGGSFYHEFDKSADLLAGFSE